MSQIGAEPLRPSVSMTMMMEEKKEEEKQAMEKNRMGSGGPFVSSKRRDFFDKRHAQVAMRL